VKFGKTGLQVEVNVAQRSALFQTLREKFNKDEGFALATINLDHLAKLAADGPFLTAYRAHDLVVADGRPVVWLSQIARKPLELMPGSDLILPLCKLCAEEGVPIALVGSSDAALQGAAKTLKERTPGLVVTYSRAPAFGFDPEGAEADEILKELAASGAGLCFVALGAPKQECFAAHGRKGAPKVGFASIGAGLDFLSGHQKRAPKLIRILALEWLWRLLQDPKRMGPRYLKCLAILPTLFMQAFAQRKGG
jgi:exopolysaccharide biosynthesis WecB/TagA/CpsF family protein